MLVRALLVAGLFAPVASASASSSASFGVSLRVVRSARVVAGSAAPQVAQTQLRAVPVPGGTNWVLAIGGEVQSFKSRAAGFSVTRRTASELGAQESLPSESVRFSPGTGGAWDRRDYGTHLADAGPVEQVKAPGEAPATGEVAMFVPAGAAAEAEPTYVVVTVMADGAP